MTPSGVTHIAECNCGWSQKNFKSAAGKALKAHWRSKNHTGVAKGSVRALRANEKR